MNVKLIIDVRERALIEELRGRVAFDVEQLDLGDVVFRDDDGDVLVIERKTVADLKASICDGRHREQKARLIGSGIPLRRIMYVIEGNLDRKLESKIGGFPVSTLVGSLINTQLRDNIRVYKTRSLRETAAYIYRMLDKLAKAGSGFFNDADGGVSPVQYSATLRKRKKDNMRPSTWFIALLALLPQISEKAAAVITAEYPTMRDLVMAYEGTPETDRPTMLADLVVVLSTGKRRRVGIKVSTRVFNFVHGIN